MWVYTQSEKGLFTVGYWHDKYFAGEHKTLPVWEPVEDFTVEAEARKLVHYLNGGKDHERQAT
jgi:hypothetical protein